MRIADIDALARPHFQPLCREEERLWVRFVMFDIFHRNTHGKVFFGVSKMEVALREPTLMPTRNNPEFIILL